MRSGRAVKCASVTRSPWRDYQCVEMDPMLQVVLVRKDGQLDMARGSRDGVIAEFECDRTVLQPEVRKIELDVRRQLG